MRQRGPRRWRQGAAVPAPVSEMGVGRCMRSLRMKRGFSLRTLAHESGLAVNTLSLIENGKVSPSVSTLQRVALTLGVPMTAFFETQPPEGQVTCLRGGQRSRLTFTHGLLEDLGRGMVARMIEPFLITLDPNADSGPTAIVHPGQEFVFCLDGQLQYVIEDGAYELHPGDSLLFEALLPHRWANPGPEPSTALLVLCPLGGQGRPSVHHFGT